MKKFLLACILFIITGSSFATHIIGGEMRYEYVGPGAAPNSKQYRIKLLLLRGPTGVGFQTFYVVGVYNNDNNQKVIGTAANNNWSANQDFPGLLPVPIIISTCIANPPNLIYDYKTYSFLIDLPDNNRGYTAAFQTFSRQNSNNINNGQGSTYSCEIPGLFSLANPFTDNSPQYKLPISVICENSPFTLDFSATDAEGDSLVYSFCNAYNGGAAQGGNFDNPAPPPYQSVIYTSPYNAISPMGPLASINPATGIISGIAPPGGKYVICVCASEYRNGQLITVHRKDLIVEVSSCVPTVANPLPSFTTCDGFNIQFSHNSTGANSVFWDFGDPTTLADTSHLDNPVYVYPDTGVYFIKFVINRGEACADSAIRRIGVYPGFFPGFTVGQPQCIGVPLQFTDTTRSIYTPANAWRWNFGDPATLADTSRIRNPLYTYPAAGTYNVQFIVSSDRGCIDTVYKDVVILPPPPINMLFRDSGYCGLDTLQLGASGTGSFSWTPNSFILNASTGTPLVFPPVPTKYYVTLNDNGCISKDSVTVRPLNDLVAAITGIEGICEEDTTLLSGSANHSPVTWQWNNVATVESPTAQNTRVYPPSTTNYILTARWGNNCVATANKTIAVIPLAVPAAGPDTAFCAGSGGVRLSASGGSSYLWSPATGLSATNVPNPLANPATTTTYTVSVGVNGCSRRRVDSVVVTVRPLPTMTLINDTLICSIDTLQLTTTGTGNFTWTPNYNISSLTGPSPLVSPDVPTKYYTTLTDAFGCVTKDSVFVDVKLFVTLDAGNDTTLCKTDGFLLNPTSDALSYKWTPATYLDRDDIKRPLATPLATTKYYVTGNIGKCQTTDSVNITVVNYPAAKASPDTTVCLGTNAQLQASGGTSYTWSPATFLSASNISNPVVIGPTANIRYIVTVSDTLGCPKPSKDTVFVKVYPKVIADAGPRDTSVVEGEPLQLNGSGGDIYLWSPGTWLTSTISRSPVSLPQDDIEYALLVKTLAGCEGRDSIRVKLYKVDPSMYVPTAFSPNGDKNNDVLRPILLGMKDLTYFRVYNRWGQLMFSTGEKNKGWDGNFAGRPQQADTYVWVAEGITYKGQAIRKKGYAVLIR
jgi:gliding motility-associated-like protein